MRWCLPSARTEAWHMASAPLLLSLLEPSCRGKGLGTEAVLAMLSYGKKV